MINFDPKTGRIGFTRDDGSIEWCAPEEVQALDSDGKPPPSADVVLRVARGRFAPKLWQAAAPVQAARLRATLEQSERLRPLIEALRIGGSVADMADKPTIELHVAEVDALLRLALDHLPLTAPRPTRRPSSHHAFLAFLASLPREISANLRTLHDLRGISGYRAHEVAIKRTKTRSSLLQEFIQRGV